MTLDEGSIEKLSKVHADLERVVRTAADITDLPFRVLEGIRSLDRQKQMVAQGKSKTMNSRHLDGHAVDIGVLIDGKLTWEWDYYERLAKIVKKAAELEQVAITWGGDWKFKDGVHFELSWSVYK